MSDLVERLRRKAFRGPTMEAVHTKTIEWEAADKIDHLTAALAEARGEINRVSDMLAKAKIDAWNAAIKKADAALLTRSCTCYKDIRALRKDTP